MNILKKIQYYIAVVFLCLTSIIIPNSASAISNGSFTVSPMHEFIILNPGEHYESSFRLTKPNAGDPTKYKLSTSPYYVNEQYISVFDDSNEHSMMSNWITITSPTSGTIEPNGSKNITFEIDVPNDIPAGGQYASILVTLDDDETDDKENSASVKEVMNIAYVIYAEIAGNTIRGGEINDLSVPSFLLSGNITGSSSIKNTGNVHGRAAYKLQVFPIFSNEEVYTNEEDPQTKTILPDRTLYNETIWENTPAVGIFNVVYTVEFEGVTEQMSKMVIKCPIWLLFLVIFALIALIIYIILRAKNKSKKARKSDD